MRSYRDLVVWQKAMELVIVGYRITQAFPKSEVYGLASQMRRAAVSVPSNIAEGHGLKQTQAYLRHLAIASGPLCDLETQIEISGRLGYISRREKDVITRANEVGRMLFGLRQSLQTRP